MYGIRLHTFPDGTILTRLAGCSYCQRWTRTREEGDNTQYPYHREGCEFVGQPTPIWVAHVDPINGEIKEFLPKDCTWQYWLYLYLGGCITLVREDSKLLEFLLSLRLESAPILGVVAKILDSDCSVSDHNLAVPGAGFLVARKLNQRWLKVCRKQEKAQK